MVSLIIRKMDIEPLLSFFEATYSNTYKKTWECGNTINAVYIGTELALRTFSEQSITVIIIYDRINRECEMSAIASGGGSGLLRIDWGSELAAEGTIMKNIMNLAKTYDWELSKRYPSRKGRGCPFCKAYYLYNQDQIQDDGSVSCQNCGRSFILDVGLKWESHEERIV